MTTIPAQRIVFTGKQQVHLEDHEAEAPGPRQIRIRSHSSLMSTGTENIVFNRNFDPGTHWDHWVKYPFFPGYAISGHVDAVGDEVQSFRPGDRVVARWKHQSHPLVDIDRCFPLPEEIDMELAPWFALAKIAMHGALAADYRMGDSVVIIGAGPIGQMSLRWAIAAGASPVIVVDPVQQREVFAIKGGASAYIASTVAEAKEKILSINGGQAPDKVIDTTGHAVVFASALDLARPGGRVVVLGDTGSPASQALTSDAIIKGLTIIAAHDGNQIPGWDPARIIALFFRLVGDGRFFLSDLNTHKFVAADCAEAYATANRERQNTMGILFDWSR